MNTKTITPGVQEPVDRVASGLLPSALAELNEAALAGAGVTPSSDIISKLEGWCSFDGDE